jgi:hypothetical protein
MASSEEAAKKKKDKETSKKVFLALAYMSTTGQFFTVNEIANWIKSRWRAEEPPSEGHVRNVLSKMKEADKSRHSDKLLETHGLSPCKYRLGDFTAKTTASAEMLLKILKKVDRISRGLSAEDEEQIKQEISVKYSIPPDILNERLEKAIKGKYLKRINNGLLKPLDRLSEYEREFLSALQQFDFDHHDGTERTDSDESESNPVAQQHSPPHVENNTQKARRKGND